LALWLMEKSSWSILMIVRSCRRVLASFAAAQLKLSLVSISSGKNEECSISFESPFYGYSGISQYGASIALLLALRTHTSTVALCRVDTNANVTAVDGTNRYQPKCLIYLSSDQFIAVSCVLFLIVL
jgi:hypothetical protein